MADLLTIDEARARVLAAVRRCAAEDVAVAAALGRVLAEDVDRRPRRARLRQQRDGRLRDPLAARPGGGCGSSASRARGRRHRCPSATARRSGSPPARRCPTAPTRSCRSRRAEDDGDAVTPREDVRRGQPRARPGRGPAARQRPSCAPARRSGPAELGIAVEAGRATVRCARAAARRGRSRPATSSWRPAASSAPASCTTPTRVTLGALARRAGAVRHQRRRRRRRRAGARARRSAPRSTAADVLLLTGRRVRRPARPRQAGARRRSASRRSSGAWPCAPGKPSVVRRAAATSSSSACPATPCRRWSRFLLFARPALAVLQGARRHAAARARLLGEAVRRQPRAARTASACGSTTAARCRPARRARTSSPRCSAPRRWPSSPRRGRAARGHRGRDRADS